MTRYRIGRVQRKGLDLSVTTIMFGLLAIFAVLVALECSKPLDCDMTYDIDDVRYCAVVVE